MASGENIVGPGEKVESQDIPDGYHVGITYTSGLVWFYHLLFVQASKTGPKGVLADYSLHQAELEEQRERKQREISNMMEKEAVNFKEEVQ